MGDGAEHTVTPASDIQVDITTAGEGPGARSRRAPFRRLGRRLIRLGPRLANIRHLFGPIFNKELRVAARRKRSYVLRTVYLGLLTLTVSLAWMVVAEEAQNVGRARGAMAMGMFAPWLLIACGWFQLFGMTLIGPVLTSGSISEERSRRTLNVLLMTPVTPWQIVTGKLLSPTLQMLLLVGLTLPVLAMVQVYGGVETWDLLATTALCLASGLFAASLGMLISTFSNRVYVTILNSYFILLGLYIFVPFVLAWMMFAAASMGPGPPRFAMGVLTAINPFISMYLLDIEIISPGMLGLAGVWGWQGWLWIPATVVHVTGALALALLATWRVRRLVRQRPRRRDGPFPAERTATVPPTSPPTESGGPQQDLAAALTGQVAVATGTARPAAGEPTLSGASAVGTAGGGATFPSGTALPRQIEPRGRRSRPVGDNPVLWRELHRRIVGRSVWWWIGVVVLLLMLLAIYGIVAYENGLREEEFHAMIMVIYLILVLLEAAVFAPPTITSEKESSSWPILLSTTLSGSAVLCSKAAGVFRRIVPISLLLVAHVTLFTLFGCLHPAVLLHTALIGGGFVSFLVAVGLWFSVRMRRTAGAVVCTILSGFTLWAILPVVVGTLWGIMFHGDEGFEAILSINPLAWMVVAGAGGADAMSRRDTTPYEAPFTGELSIGEFTGWLLLVCGAYFAVALGLLAHSIVRFNRVSGRTS